MINNNTDTALNVAFSRFWGYNNPEAEACRSYEHAFSLFLIQRCLRGTPLGFCLRVILKEKPINLEKATFSVLSVLLLIYDCEI